MKYVHNMYLTTVSIIRHDRQFRVLSIKQKPLTCVKVPRKHNIKIATNKKSFILSIMMAGTVNQEQKVS